MSGRGCRCGGNCCSGGTRPFLPIDTPPRTTRLPSSSLVGLSWSADLGQATTPVPRPFAQFQSSTFPQSLPSAVGPAAIAPRFGFSVNDYSPVDHWVQRQRAELGSGTRVIAQPFARGAKGPRRIRGRVIPYPPTNPVWRSISGRLVN